MIGPVTQRALISIDPSNAHSPTHKRDELYKRFKTKISVNAALDRALVSFQANKNVPFSGWFKYREGFSESLVDYLLRTVTPTTGILLDPFSGAGSALFAASNLGWQSRGIEVLPVGIYATRARFIIGSGRSHGKKAFNKGYICTFREAIFEKLNQIAFDLEVNPVQQSLFEES